MKLSEFFQEPYIDQALNAYVAARPNWDISTKMELYAYADTAFDYELPEQERRQAFSNIYVNLKSYWKVFRNAQSYWDANTTFSALNALELSQRGSGLDLITLNADIHSADILRELLSLRNLKKTKITHTWLCLSSCISQIQDYIRFLIPMLFGIQFAKARSSKTITTFATVTS